MIALGYVLIGIVVLAALIGPAFVVAAQEGWATAIRATLFVLVVTAVLLGLLVAGAFMITGHIG